MAKLASNSGLRRGALLCLALLVAGLGLSSLAARPEHSAGREYVASLSEEKRDELSRNYERFMALDRAERDRIARLDEDLDNARDGQELRALIPRYYDWLAHLPEGEATKLQSLPVAERIVKIRQESEQQKTLRRNRDDRAVLLAFFEQQIIATLPEPERQRLEQAPPLERRMIAMREFSRGGLAGELFKLSDDDVAQLRDKLSPDLRARLARALGPVDRGRVIVSRLRDIPRGPAEDSAMLFNDEERRANDKAMKEFFEHELSQAQRDHLLSLPATQMESQLRREYMRSKFPWLPSRGGALPEYRRGNRDWDERERQREFKPGVNNRKNRDRSPRPDKKGKLPDAPLG